MKFTKLTCTALVVFLLLGMLSLTAVYAETQPDEIGSQPVATDAPPATDIVVTPTESGPSQEPVTDATDATEVPTEGTASDEPTNAPARPTEYAEGVEPDTYSDYVSPPPAYTPAEQDYEEVEWEEIKLDLNSNTGGVGDFSAIKNNNSAGDEQNYVLLIVGIILVALALAGFTFSILYKPKKATAKASSQNVSSRKDGTRTRAHGSQKASEVTRYSPSQRKNVTTERRPDRDDYNDGF